ncbi:MAG TPA: hypothetical protein VHX12_10765, partial [Acidisoma sp.]|nr:hypothetical protein [Acidisoma sp.]
MRIPLSTVLSGLFALILLVGLATPVLAQQAAPPAAADHAAPQPPLSAVEAQQLLSVLQNPQKREQFIKTLTGLEKALPATAAPAAPTAAGTTPAPASGSSSGSAAKPAAAATTAATPAKSSVALKPNSLGADLIDQADSVLSELDTSLIVTLTRITQYHAVGAWLSEAARDPFILSIILSAVWRLALILLIAFGCEYAVWHFTERLYRRLGRDSRAAEARGNVEIAGASDLPLPADGAPEHGADLFEGAEGTEAESEIELASAQQEQLPVPTEPISTGSAPTEAIADASTDVAPATDARRRNGRAGFTRLRPFHSGWPLLRRLPFILGAMVVDALPPLAFLAAATLLLASPIVSDFLMRLMIEAVVNAYVLCRLLLVVARGTFCAPSSKLRLLHISDSSAAFLAFWCRRIALVVVLGFAVVQIGGLSGMEPRVQHGIGRVFGLIIHLMLVVMVLKRRREVEAWLRGRPGEKPSFWHNMKTRLASVWHWQAIIVIMLVWIVFATEFMNHVQHPTRLILGTLGILISFRVVHIVLLGGLEKVFALNADFSDPRRALIAKRAARYHLPLRVLTNFITSMALLFLLMQFWGLNILQWLRVGDLGTRLFSSL